jgi:hypothetical protein
MLQIRIATTPEEKEAVYRSRYAIYVEEMGRYQAVADHARKRLADPEDDYSWIVYAHDGTNVVASTRLTWGGDGFSERQIAQYGLESFLDEIPATAMVVGERTMICQAWRGGGLFVALSEGTRELTAQHDVRVVFGACEPHLLSFYAEYQRPYAARNVNSAETGYLIPLIAFPGGPEALSDLGDGPGTPRCVRDALDCTGTVSSPLWSDPATYWQDLRGALATLAQPPGGLFDGFTDDEIECCAARSNIIDCARGDRVLKEGGTARNVFVVLAGALEVSTKGHVVGAVLPGEVFGETAFLLQQPRGFDVDVVSEDTRILSLSERSLRALTDKHPVVAAKLLTNIGKTLCRRLQKAG